MREDRRVKSEEYKHDRNKTSDSKFRCALVTMPGSAWAALLPLEPLTRDARK